MEEAWSEWRKSRERERERERGMDELGKEEHQFTPHTPSELHPSLEHVRTRKYWSNR
jgi:hypothetical protein